MTAKGFDNRLTLTYGLNEHVNYYLFNKMGVPAPYSHFFHFRVIDDEREAPDPWHGDFWGLALAEEPYDVRFLEAHNLEKGNLYKLINATDDAKEQQNYQAPHAVTDGSDHNTIQYNLNNRSTPDFIRSPCPAGQMVRLSFAGPGHPALRLLAQRQQERRVVLRAGLHAGE